MHLQCLCANYLQSSLDTRICHCKSYRRYSTFSVWETFKTPTWPSLAVIAQRRELIKLDILTCFEKKTTLLSLHYFTGFEQRSSDCCLITKTTSNAHIVSLWESNPLLLLWQCAVDISLFAFESAHCTLSCEYKQLSFCIIICAQYVSYRTRDLFQSNLNMIYVSMFDSLEKQQSRQPQFFNQYVIYPQHPYFALRL